MSETTFDFIDGKGHVPAHRHTNPDGSTGGWVADSAQVYGDAWVSGDPDIMFGRSGAYDWTAMRVADGSVWLRYGCEFHAVAEWPSVAASLAVQHEKQNAARYAALTLALVEFVAKAMPRKEIEG